MKEILLLLKEYSPGAALLIAIGSVIIFVMKLAVEKSIAAGFDAHANYVQRRSAFEDKVLIDRFQKVIDLSARLERIMTNLNRIRSGQPVPEGFLKHNEIIPLTEIFEELNVHRLTLTEDFYELLRRKAEWILQAANLNETNWQEMAEKKWVSLNDELRRLIDRDFGLSKIRW